MKTIAKCLVYHPCPDQRDAIRHTVQQLPGSDRLDQYCCFSDTHCACCVQPVAWEANQRFLEDGRYGSTKMKLMVSQNAPFLPIKEAWDAGSSDMLPINDELARKQVEEICAKVLSNRKPSYSIKGGLYDAMKDAGGEVFAVINEEAENAAQLFFKLEGNDIEPAAAVAVASLIQAVNQEKVGLSETIMLNITGGGIEKFKSENKVTYMKPLLVFALNADPQLVHQRVKMLF